MNDSTPLWVGIFICFLFAATIVATLGGIVAFIYILWDNWKKRKDDNPEGNDNGGGGSPDKPTPWGGGPEDNDHEQFHRELDQIGHRIQTEEREKEKVVAVL